MNETLSGWIEVQGERFLESGGLEPAEGKAEDKLLLISSLKAQSVESPQRPVVL